MSLVVGVVVLIQLLLASVVTDAAGIKCGLCLPHFPLYGSNYLVNYTESVGDDNFLVYPDKTSDNLDKQYFVNEINFDDAPSGSFFIGAKNSLYEFNQATLKITKQYNWKAETANVQSCESNAKDPEVACHNHIRLYKKLSFTNSDNRLLVCGTGAYSVNCRTLSLSNINDSSEVGPVTPKLDIGVISLHPLIPFAGDFLDDPTQGYQTTGYTESTELNTYDFARYNVSYDNSTKAINFTSTPSRTIQTTNDFHIRDPYLPVKLIKQDLDGSNNYKMFYFFIRERKYYPLVSDAVSVRSRIIRVCQDDKGLVINNNLFFKTYLKAEILCFGNALTTPEGVGAQEHYYTVLRDVVVTDTKSRWYDNTNVWFRMMYGVFSTDVYGPNGTAVCVYHAHFSTGSDAILTTSFRGIIDVFNLNNYYDEQGTPEGGNYLNCASANNREDDKGDHIIAEDPIEPFKGLSLPLVEMQGEIITKIQTQQVCVRRYNDENKCVMQDVLFVGTEKGRVKKIAFSTVSGSQSPELNSLSHDAIISQEWELADESSVEQLSLKDDYLFVTTYTRIYKFPVANCERHLNCRDCVGSRDPHCYWNTTSGLCERNTLGGTGEQPYDFPSSAVQNLHTGEDAACNALPNCSVDVTATAYNTFEIVGLDSCTYSNSYSVLVEPYVCQAGQSSSDAITFTVTEGQNEVTDSAILGRRLHSVTLTAIGDSGNSSYNFIRETPNGAPVVPTGSEVSARAINSTHVEVTVSLEGCNIHDELKEYSVAVQCTDSSNNNQTLPSQPYSGVNSFVCGPYKGCESISYIVTVMTSRGMKPTTPYTVTTLASVPASPTNLNITRKTASSLTLEWRSGYGGLCDTTGYSVKVNGTKRSDCSTTDTVYTLTGLFAYTTYELSVTACSEGGESESESIVETTECDRPFPVTNLQPSNDDSSTSIDFSWYPPLYVNGTYFSYGVLVECYNHTSMGTEQLSDNTSTTSYMISGLDPLTRCCLHVSVTSYCGDRTQTSEPQTSCGVTSDDIPGPVELLTVSTLSPYSVFVSWSPPDNYSNPGLKYEIKWKYANMVNDSDMVIDQLYYIITELEPNTQYTISVTGVNDVGYGSESEKQVTTLVGVPTSPHDVEISFSGCTMTIAWEHNDRVEFSVSQYQVRTRCNGQFFNATVGSNTNSHTFPICNGEASGYLAWCSAQVRARNDIGYSDFSNFADAVFPLIPPSKPDVFITENVGSSVRISFTLSAPYALDRLTVNFSLTPLPSSDNPTNHTFNGTNVLVFNGLIRTKTYRFTLMLCDWDVGCSDPSSLEFQPSQVPPKPPVNISVSEITYDSFILNWDHSPGENSSILLYHIHVTRGDDQSQDYFTRNTNVEIVNLTASTAYFYVIRAVDTAANLSGPLSNSDIVMTSFGTLNPPENIQAVFTSTADGSDTSSEILALKWDEPTIQNDTIKEYIITWSPALGFECSDMTYSVSTNSTATSQFIMDPEGISVIDNPEITICVRSVNNHSASGWTYTTIESIRTIIESVVDDNEESKSIGFLAGAIILAVTAIVVAIVLVIVLACVISKRKKIEKGRNSPDNEVGEASDHSNHVYSTPEKKDLGHKKKEKHKRTPERMESTRSTAPIINGNRNGDE